MRRVILLWTHLSRTLLLLASASLAVSACRARDAPSGAASTSTPPAPQSSALASPVTLAAEQRQPTSIALDATHVYWTGFGGIGQPSGVVMKVSKAGGAPIALATAELHPAGIAVDGESVYWTSLRDGSVRKVAKSGGDPVTVFSGGGQSEGIALDDANLYVTDRQTGAVWRIPKRGGPAKAIAEGQRYPQRIAAARGEVIWINMSSLSGQNGSVGRLRGGEAQTLPGGLGSPAGLAVDEESVYTRVSVPDDDPPPAAKLLLGAGLRSELWVIARDGSSHRVLWQGDVGAALAVDRAYVYFAGAGAGAAKVQRVAKGGGAPEILATVPGWVSDITADESGVYFVTNLSPDRPVGDVKKLARQAP